LAMPKRLGRAMGKQSWFAQNGEVPEHATDGATHPRRRPEDIVAGAFHEPPPPSATETWSVRSRRTILAAMAVAGGLMVGAGLALTGGLGPGPGHPRPIEVSPDASVLAQTLLRPVTESQASVPTSAPASPTTAITTSPKAPTRSPESLATTVLPPTTSATSPPATHAPPTGPGPTPTTQPCRLLTDQIGSAVSLPLCP